MDKTNFVITDSSTIHEALKKIDLNKIGMVFIENEKQSIIGVATDGDIRETLLNKSSLSDGIRIAYNSNFVWKKDTDSRESILKLLDSQIRAIPILDSEMKLVDIITAAEFPPLIEKNIYARSRAPVRVSFAGGGSDVTHYFMEERGAVINSTISLYSHATLKQRNDKKIIIDSLDLNKKVTYSNFDDLVNKSDEFDLFRSLISIIRPNFGFELSVNSDFPSGSGLGGSSAVMVSILGVFNEFRRDKWDDYELAELAFQAERLNMGVSGGWQDQYATVFGGFNFIELQKDTNLIHPLRLKKRTILELEENMVLYKITSGRNSGSIHDDQKVTMQNKNVQNMVHHNVNHCYKMRESLLKGKLDEFGSGLNIAWKNKRQFSKKISNKDIDKIYEYAIKNGALGGKLLGAGGGGFFLFYIKNPLKNKFLAAMKKINLHQTIFHFDKDGMQSWINRDSLV